MRISDLIPSSTAKLVRTLYVSLLVIFCIQPLAYSQKVIDQNPPDVERQRRIAESRNEVVNPMPADLAGKIPPAKGTIAYINNGDVYVMNVDGSNARLACRAGNAYGRLSWSPNNKFILFTRRGQADIQSPDGLGGRHRLYDIFKVVMDSVGRNSDWWLKVTETNGSRFPEWSKDGSRIIFTQDLNANYVDALYPNYQTAVCDSMGGSMEFMRKDHEVVDFMAINPTFGPDGKYAFTPMYEKQPQGLFVCDPANTPMPTLDEVKERVKGFESAIAPSWSPDGKWIAYIHNDMANPGIYIVAPDMKTKYLLYRPTAPGIAPTTVPPSWSPDSKWLTFSTDDGRIWICDLTGKQLQAITRAGANISPGWSR